MAPLLRQLAPCAVLICRAAAVSMPTSRSSVRAAAISLAEGSESSRKILASARAIVALGQSLNKDGSPAQTLVRRAEEAAAAYRQLGSLPIITTGGDPAHAGVTEAEVMRRLLGEKGVPLASVVLEPTSLTTVQNAIFSLVLLENLSTSEVVLVTSDFHMPRALYTFEAVFRGKNLTIEPRPAKGGCAPNDAPPGAHINEESLVQRLRGEVAIIKDQVAQEFLPSELPDTQIRSPGRDRIEVALNEAKAMLVAAEEAQHNGGGMRASLGGLASLCLLLQMLDSAAL